ncbi:hypothetical protein EPUS_02732 [Endocarpon pusillum Z07020]|uniref:Integral membrane protein DUF92-domain-containing protein n=1 Tax=Endocarpon pusillum (strain Z07020 / HMAS-L-300199) TaxID=1263415 RepID=U1G9B2_ENDPU|nr:uncharacterized protein EPUS_02732 [Endocarpon pusillum Z07020]ERF68276.1 hypothetical protein EPUS_02732 [Endocarpon pusillum Z07020]
MKPLYSLPVTGYLIYRSYTHNSLTPLGIVTAALTALLHSSHRSALPFSLLVVFFLAGTRATKLKHDVKSRYTLSSTGSGSSPSSSAARRGGGDGGEPRTHVQVLANSGVASFLLLLHLYRTNFKHGSWSGHVKAQQEEGCVPTTGSVEGLLLAGIVANYAAVAADTFSSELGILAQNEPRLITRPWVRVPRGTNGGVTAAGLAAGVLGSLIIAVASTVVMPFCGASQTGRLGPVGRVLMAQEKAETYRGWTLTDKLIWILAVTGGGALGSVLDSLFGAILQASVVDRRTGKIVEGAGGEKVLVSSRGKGKTAKREVVHSERNRDEALRETKAADMDGRDISAVPEESRSVLTGMDWLDNNQINLLMAACMSFGSVALASWYWGIPLSRLWT